MRKDYKLAKRKYVIGGIVLVIACIYIVRLFSLQVLNDEYKQYADGNRIFLLDFLHDSIFYNLLFIKRVRTACKHLRPSVHEARPECARSTLRVRHRQSPRA